MNHKGTYLKLEIPDKMRAQILTLAINKNITFNDAVLLIVNTGITHAKQDLQY